MSNFISTAIPAKALADALDHLKQARAALEPYLHALTPKPVSNGNKPLPNGLLLPPNEFRGLRRPSKRLPNGNKRFLNGNKPLPNGSRGAGHGGGTARRTP